MELRTEEKPDTIPLGGEQSLAVEQFPGGNVSVQNFGAGFREISWSGWFEGTDAFERMEQIEAMRTKGEKIVLETEKYSLDVVIKSFQPEHKKNFYIPFSLTLIRVIDHDSGSKDTVDKAAEAIKREEAESGMTEEKEETYTVKSGDTLSKIALKFLGNANAYDKIYQDNKAILTKGPHKIYPGQVLVIRK